MVQNFTTVESTRTSNDKGPVPVASCQVNQVACLVLAMLPVFIINGPAERLSKLLPHKAGNRGFTVISASE